MAAACATRGATLIDCPISGGPSGAAAGTLAMMVSGDASRIESLRPMFAAWGQTVVIAGDKPGAAQILKLTNNILFAVSIIATSEAMVMGSRGGLSSDAMLQVINNGTGRNFSTMTLFPKAVFTGTYDFGATLDTLMKDVDLAIERVRAWAC
ncbi:MAG: NAD-binding protein [Burkholderiaceae bacterium]